MEGQAVRLKPKKGTIPMANAAAALLKGANKVKLDAELTTAPAAKTTTPVKPTPKPKAVAKAPEPAPVVEEEGEEEQIKIEDMTEDQIDTLVQDNELDVGDDWDTYDHAQKIAYLNEHYGTEQAEPDAEEEEADAEPAPGLVLVKTDASEAVAETHDDGNGEATATKATKKTAAKKATKVKEAAIVVADAVVDQMVHEIENLKEDQIKGYISGLTREGVTNVFKMAGALSVISAQGWYEPYSSFKEYVEQALDMKYRRIQYWISTYNAIVQNKIAWDDVSEVGWTKLKEIAAIVTPETVAHWVGVCKVNNTYTVKELVAAAMAKENGTAPEGESKATVTTTLSFKVHEDQKETINAAIEKGKAESQTTVAAVALEMICADYLSGGTSPLHERLQKIGVDAALDALKVAFPNFVFEPQLAA